MYGATPVETLHAILLGIMKYTLKSLFNYSEISIEYKKGSKVTTNKKIFNSAEFERRIRTLSAITKRQSDRSLPRSTFSRGVCTLAGLSGQEYIGLSILSIIALPGCFLLNWTVTKEANRMLRLEKDFTELLWLGVSLYQSLQLDYISKQDGLFLLDTKVRYYIFKFCNVCGDQRRMVSRVGTKLTKLHAMIHLVSSIKKYGVPNNYFGGILESLLKTFVKQPSKRTRKMHGDAFLLDLSNRWSECQMVQQFVEMNPVNLYTIQVDQKK